LTRGQNTLHQFPRIISVLVNCEKYPVNSDTDKLDGVTLLTGRLCSWSR